MGVDLVVYPSKLKKNIMEVAIPGDKSISHRALIFASIALGTSYITNFLASLDCLATLKALRQLGVIIEYYPDRDPTQVVVHGQGLDRFLFLSMPIILDLGNSGTSIRLLSGLLAATNVPVILTGDETLRRRPMRRITQPLRDMGVKITGEVRGQEEYAPLHIQPTDKIIPIDYRSVISSAQVKSCLLLAALQADGISTIQEPEKSRDHSECMLGAMGVVIQEQENKIKIQGRQIIQSLNYIIPGDISSAAFLMVAAAITPGAVMVIPGVGINSTRTGIIDLLRQMGVDIRLTNQIKKYNELAADIKVIGPERLKAIMVPKEAIVGAIDEFPVFFIAAACAVGTTVITGAAELRHKESDRLAVMARALGCLGVKVSLDLALGDMSIVGPNVFQPQLETAPELEIDTMGDHRIAMALVIASLKLTTPVILKNTENIATSFPGFFSCVKKLGFKLNEVQACHV